MVMSLPFSPIRGSSTSMRIAFEEALSTNSPLHPLYARINRLLKSGSGRTRVPTWSAPSVSIRL